MPFERSWTSIRRRSSVRRGSATLVRRRSSAFEGLLEPSSEALECSARVIAPSSEALECLRSHREDPPPPHAHPIPRPINSELPKRMATYGNNQLRVDLHIGSPMATPNSELTPA